MDHDGVSEEPADRVDEFAEQLMKDPEHLLRYRLKEEGMVYRYGGTDLIDLKPVDWVELVDRAERTYRIAVQRDNHLMVRFAVITRDSTSRERTEEVTFYANYHALDGVQTALQVARTRDGGESSRRSTIRARTIRIWRRTSSPRPRWSSGFRKLAAKRIRRKRRRRNRTEEGVHSFQFTVKGQFPLYATCGRQTATM